MLFYVLSEILITVTTLVMNIHHITGNVKLLTPTRTFPLV